MWVKAEMRKPAVPQAGIADALPRLRIHERYHQVDDVARGAELAVGAGSRQLAQEILVHVALEVVAVVGRQVHVVDGLHDGTKRGAVVNLEGGAAEEELAGVGQAGKFVELFDGVTDGVEEIVAGQRDEVAPGVARPFAGEDAGVFLVEAGQDIILLRQQAQEEQIGNLLDGIHRIVHAARPEDVHELVDLLAEAGGKEIRRRGKGLSDDGIGLCGRLRMMFLSNVRESDLDERAIGLAQGLEDLLAAFKASERGDATKLVELAGGKESHVPCHEAPECR